MVFGRRQGNEGGDISDLYQTPCESLWLILFYHNKFLQSIFFLWINLFNYSTILAKIAGCFSAISANTFLFKEILFFFNLEINLL